MNIVGLLDLLDLVGDERFVPRFLLHRIVGIGLQGLDSGLDGGVGVDC